jgi:hypothetical protein
MMGFASSCGWRSFGHKETRLPRVLRHVRKETNGLSNGGTQDIRPVSNSRNRPVAGSLQLSMGGLIEEQLALELYQ